MNQLNRQKKKLHNDLSITAYYFMTNERHIPKPTWNDEVRLFSRQCQHHFRILETTLSILFLDDFLHILRLSHPQICSTGLYSGL